MHVVWTTRGRAALIDVDVAEYLAANLPIIARQERAHLLELGIVSTHVHMLIRIHPTTSVTRLLQRMKGGTAAGINKRYPASDLRWAKGYNIDSVSLRALEAVAGYVCDQPLHHPDEAIAGRSSRSPGPVGADVALATSAEPSL
jgi:putative transposase